MWYFQWNSGRRRRREPDAVLVRFAIVFHTVFFKPTLNVVGRKGRYSCHTPWYTNMLSIGSKIHTGAIWPMAVKTCFYFISVVANAITGDHG